MDYLPRTWLPLGELANVSPIQPQATCLGFPNPTHHSPLSTSLPVRTYGRAYADVITKFSRMDRFPILLRCAPAINRPFVITIAIMTASWTISLISNTEKTHLYSLRSVNMNESDLRVNSLPYITTVWVNYLLTLKNTRQILKPRYLKI